MILTKVPGLGIFIPSKQTAILPKILGLKNMAFQEVAGQKKYIKYNECKKGDVLVEGKYLRDIQGKFGVQYEFLSESGDVVVLNKAGQLDYKMEFIRQGDVLKIIYDGSIILEKGAYAGKPSHQFILLRDDDLSELDEDGVSGHDDDDEEDSELGL